jgi:acetyl-CoA carboxylase biotin carboxyl carrier protein
MIKRKAVSKASTPKASAAAPRRGAFNDLDLETVRELARIANEFDLAEVETDPTGRIRVVRSRLVTAAAAPAPSAPSSAAGSLGLVPAAEKAEERGTMITSPFVGTFYRSPTPDAAAFVEVGQTVHKGQVVCIVEAMKLMNEIESDVDGKVLEVLVGNAEHVEYGQPLFRIEKP